MEGKEQERDPGLQSNRGIGGEINRCGIQPRCGMKCDVVAMAGYKRLR